MDNFENFLNSLPSTLSEDKQKDLLIDYFETRNGDTQLTLLNHNLRLCATVAKKLYYKFNQKVELEDLFSLCYEELYNSLERYNPYNEDKTSFSTFAYTNMSLRPIRPLEKKLSNDLRYVDSIVQGEEDDEKDLLLTHPDESEGHIAEDIATQEFINDIIKYLDSIKNGDLLKLYLGLDCSHKHTQAEIAAIKGISTQAISQKISDALKRLQNYIKRDYSFLLPNPTLEFDKPKQNINNKDNSSIQTNSIDKYAYLYFSYYGLNNYTRKSKVELSHDTNLSVNTITNYIQCYRSHLSSLSPEEAKKEFEKYAFQATLEY